MADRAESETEVGLESTFTPTRARTGVREPGCIAFSPLAQGLLTDRYLTGDIPGDSRAALAGSFNPAFVHAANLERVRSLNEIAQRRGQTLAQLAIAWTLRDPRVTSALIGASRWTQIADCLGALEQLDFTPDELAEIDRYAIDGALNIWSDSSAAG